MKILVTGSAGFIGSKVAEDLLLAGHEVTGVDNFHDYYDIRLKKYRLSRLEGRPRFKFYRADILKPAVLEEIFKKNKFGAVIHLAALAGVRASLLDPRSYLLTNGLGAMKILDLSGRSGVKKVILASTSSLYAGQRMPFKETLATDTPISPYAVSKRAAEFFSRMYHRLYGFDVTVFRYFTVYGPAGRPDMSPFKFINEIDRGRTITIYGDGSQKRDFTYIDDISRGTVSALKLRGFQTLNLGGSKSYRLDRFIALVEKFLGKKAKILRRPWQSSDMRDTLADISLAQKCLGWRPRIGLEEGVRRTVEWHVAHRDFTRRLAEV